MYLQAGTTGIGSIDLPIAEGDAGTAQTIEAIRSLILQSVRDAGVNRLALSLVQNVPAHDTLGEARAIYDWVKNNIRFTGDIYDAETLRPAREILHVRAGDCDCINGVLLPTLLESIGIEARLVTINADRSRPDLFSHIYAEANVNGQWIPLDAASKHAAFGLEPAVYWRKKVWSLHDDSNSLEGLGMYLGQDDSDGGFDASDLATLITAGTVGAANVIKAINAPYAPTTVLGTAAMPNKSLTPVAQVGVTTSGTSSVTGTLLLGGGTLLLLVLVLMRR
jgi:hypothetical protein